MHPAEKATLAAALSIIERGTHEELMGARGVYHEMVVRQLESHGRDSEEVLRG